MITDALALFWAKDIRRVSPGALGMVLQGCPLDDSHARAIAADLPYARWRRGWILLRKQPS